MAFFIRCDGIYSNDPQPDELHWSSRSHTIVENITDNNWINITSHIGHPGVAPSIVMAMGQVLMDSYNRNLDINEFDPSYFTHLQSARLVSVLISSLTIALVFIFCSRIFNLQIAFISALALSCDPFHIGLSQQAHLDAMLCFFVFATFYLYVSSFFSNSLPRKLSSGIFAGFSILTKPTALVIFPLLIGFRCMFAARNKKSIFTFSDVYGVLLSIIVFCSLFSRMWQERSEYIYRLHVSSLFPLRLFDAGVALSDFLPFALLLLVAFVSLYLLKYRSSDSRIAFLLKIFILLLALISLVAGFPHIARNFLLFISWTLGLTSAGHEHYGHSVEPSTYLSLLFSHLPSLVIITFCAKPFIFVLLSKNNDEDIDVVKYRDWAIFLCAVILIWVLPLSFSSKRTIRYILPIYPFIYILFSMGLFLLLKLLRTRYPEKYSVLLPPAFLSFLLILSMQVISWRGSNLFFYNYLSGGLGNHLGKASAMPIVGTSEILQEVGNIVADKRQRYLLIATDYEVAKYIKRHNRSLSTPLIKYNTSECFTGGEYILLSRRFLSFLPKPIASYIESAEALKSYSIKGIEMAWLYKSPTPDDISPLNICLQSSRRITGEISGANLIAETGKHQKGEVSFGTFLPVNPGKYRLSFMVHAADKIENKDAKLLDASLSRSCSRSFNVSDLKEQSTVLELVCEYSQYKVLQEKIYWHAQQSIELSDMKIEKLKQAF